MGKIVGRIEAEQHVHIGEAQVGVQQQHFLAVFSKSSGQIDGHIGLADASLATADRDYLDRSGIHDFSQSGCLIQCCFRHVHCSPSRQMYMPVLPQKAFYVLFAST